MIKAATPWPYKLGLLLAAFIVFLYMWRVDADSMAGLFGIFLSDEGPYLLSAKHKALFGTAHFFEKDVWQPELMVPLLHWFASLTITLDEPILWVRIGMAVQVLLGIGILAWVAAHYHKSLGYGLACFLCISLNPILFFYARSGLAEGQQFLLLSLVLALLYLLHHTRDVNRACLFAALAGALTGLMFIAKISAIAACIGCAVGTAFILWNHPYLKYRLLPASLYALAGLAVLGLYFGLFIGDGFGQWWTSNVGFHAASQTPKSVLDALEWFTLKPVYLAYYLALMPIFAFYVVMLLAAATRSRSYLAALVIITLSITLMDYFALASIRRNFFNLALLSIVAGFICIDYLRSGIRLAALRSWLGGVAIFVSLCMLYGVISLLFEATFNADVTYAVMAALFLLIFVFLLLLSYTEQMRARCFLTGMMVVASIAPMLVQTFYAPETRKDIIAAIEEITAQEGVLLGSTAPWYLQGLKRKMAFTNCVHNEVYLVYVNDMSTLPDFKHSYFLGQSSIEYDPCAPKDHENYAYLGEFKLFMPENYGRFYGQSKYWRYHRTFYLYGKNTP